MDMEFLLLCFSPPSSSSPSSIKISSGSLGSSVYTLCRTTTAEPNNTGPCSNVHVKYFFLLLLPSLKTLRTTALPGAPCTLVVVVIFLTWNDDDDFA